VKSASKRKEVDTQEKSDSKRKEVDKQDVAKGRQTRAATQQGQSLHLDLVQNEDNPKKEWKPRGDGVTGTRLSSVTVASVTEAQRVMFEEAVTALKQAVGEL
jgi:hypothetical protein